MKPETKAVIVTANTSGGSLTETDVAAIASDPETRLTLLLVRCGGGRFLAPAQDVQHFIDIIAEHNVITVNREKLDGWVTDVRPDYVRDVSLPADFKVEGDKPDFTVHHPLGSAAPLEPKDRKAFDSFTVPARPMTPRQAIDVIKERDERTTRELRKADHVQRFRHEDDSCYSGAFDGTNVTSDADPGL